MFSQEPGLAVVKYDELTRFVAPAIPQAQYNVSSRIVSDSTMQESAREFDNVRWSLSIKT
jgi:hypothetical protein